LRILPTFSFTPPLISRALPLISFFVLDFIKFPHS
jgi:hypothetical protein